MFDRKIESLDTYKAPAELQPIIRESFLIRKQIMIYRLSADEFYARIMVLLQMHERLSMEAKNEYSGKALLAILSGIKTAEHHCTECIKRFHNNPTYQSLETLADSAKKFQQELNDAGLALLMYLPIVLNVPLNDIDMSKWRTAEFINRLIEYSNLLWTQKIETIDDVIINTLFTNLYTRLNAFAKNAPAITVMEEYIAKMDVEINQAQNTLRQLRNTEEHTATRNKNRTTQINVQLIELAIQKTVATPDRQKLIDEKIKALNAEKERLNQHPVLNLSIPNDERKFEAREIIQSLNKKIKSAEQKKDNATELISLSARVRNLCEDLEFSVDSKAARAAANKATDIDFRFHRITQIFMMLTAAKNNYPHISASDAEEKHYPRPSDQPSAEGPSAVFATQFVFSDLAKLGLFQLRKTPNDFLDKIHEQILLTLHGKESIFSIYFKKNAQLFEKFKAQIFYQQIKHAATLMDINALLEKHHFKLSSRSSEAKGYEAQIDRNKFIAVKKLVENAISAPAGEAKTVNDEIMSRRLSQLKAAILPTLQEIFLIGHYTVPKSKASAAPFAILVTSAPPPLPPTSIPVAVQSAPPGLAPAAAIRKDAAAAAVVANPLAVATPSAAAAEEKVRSRYATTAVLAAPAKGTASWSEMIGNKIAEDLKLTKHNLTVIIDPCSAECKIVIISKDKKADDEPQSLTLNLNTVLSLLEKDKVPLFTSHRQTGGVIQPSVANLISESLNLRGATIAAKLNCKQVSFTFHKGKFIVKTIDQKNKIESVDFHLFNHQLANAEIIIHANIIEAIKHIELQYKLQVKMHQQHAVMPTEQNPQHASPHRTASLFPVLRPGSTTRGKGPSVVSVLSTYGAAAADSKATAAAGTTDQTTAASAGAPIIRTGSAAAARAAASDSAAATNAAESADRDPSAHHHDHNHGHHHGHGLKLPAIPPRVGKK